MEIDDFYPASIYICGITGKVKFFLGDRWLEIGKLDMSLNRHRCVFELYLPDVEEWIGQRETLDDGTFDWVDWGVRLN